MYLAMFLAVLWDSDAAARRPTCLGPLARGTAITTVLTTWSETWTLDRLATAWGREPDVLERDTAGTPTRAGWTSTVPGTKSANCTAFVDVGGTPEGRQVELELSSRNVGDLSSSHDMFLHELAVPDERRIRDAVAAHVRSRKPWIDYFFWTEGDRVLGRELVHGETVTLEIQVSAVHDERQVTYRYRRVLAPVR